MHGSANGKQNRRAAAAAAAAPPAKKRVQNRSQAAAAMKDVQSTRKQPHVDPVHLSVPESKESFYPHQPGLSPLSPLSPSSSPLPGLPPVPRVPKSEQPSTTPLVPSHSRYAYDGPYLYTVSQVSPQQAQSMHPAPIHLSSPGGAYGSSHALSTPYHGGSGTAAMGGGAGAGMMSPLSTYSPNPFPPQSMSPNAAGHSGAMPASSSSFLMSPLPFGFQHTPHRHQQNSGTHMPMSHAAMHSNSLMSPFGMGQGPSGSATPLMSQASFSSMIGSPSSTAPPINSTSGVHSAGASDGAAALLSMPSPSPPLPSLPSPSQPAQGLQQSPTAPGPCLSPSMSPPPPMSSLMQTT
jgi:hypothetical protein